MTSTTVPAHASGTFDIAGKTVHRLGFGAMRITGPGIWGPPADHDTAVAVVRRAVELGVDFIDTAEAYGPYVSEEIIREALHPYPDDLLVATKVGFARTGPNAWTPLGRPEFLRQGIETALRRLDVERVDLMQLHRIDPTVPVADQIGVFVEAQQAGKIGAFGLSEVSVEQLREVQQHIAVATVQNRYNLTDRAAEDVLDHCEAAGIGFIPWFPLAAGELARPGGPLDGIVAETGATVSQVALAWLLRRSPVMLPIPGTSTVAHLEENCAGALVELDDDQVATLSALAG
jgi:pyridoxine 4-dehydrogenase